MTPREKAKDLINKFRFCDEGAEAFSAKKCAMVFINELIRIIPSELPERVFMPDINFTYWCDVRKEINDYNPILDLQEVCEHPYAFVRRKGDFEECMQCKKVLCEG